MQTFWNTNNGGKHEKDVLGYEQKSSVEREIGTFKKSIVTLKNKDNNLNK